MSDPDLDSRSTLSDNFTRLRLRGDDLLSMDVFDALVEATRTDGFSLEEIEDAKRIRANLLRRNDPQAEAFYGLVEAIVDGHSDELRRKSMVGITESRRNRLPSLAWVDAYAPSPEAIERYEAKTRELQDRLVANPRLEGKKGRVFHQKQLLGRTAELTIREGLPPYATSGPFAAAGAHRAVVRYSSGQGVPYRDRNPDVRAISIKCFPGGRETDLLMTSGPGLIARDIEEFIKLTDVMIEAQAIGEGLKGLVEAGVDSLRADLIAKRVHPYEAARMAKLIAGRDVAVPPSPAGLQFWGSVVGAGGFAFKPTLVPSEGNGPHETTVDPEDEHSLRKDLEARIGGAGLSYTLRLLFFTDDYTTPLNDATAPWDGSPVQVDVADLHIAAPGEGGPTEAEIFAMPFNPNNGFDGLAITRARCEVYRAGARGRGASAASEYRHFFVA